MKMIDIRCDGGTDIGMGHVVRCVALAEMLKDQFDVRFVMQTTSESVYSYVGNSGFSILEIPRTSEFIKDVENTISKLRTGSIVILDGYHFKTEYQKTIRSYGHKLAAIDDLHAWHQAADLVINHAPMIDKTSYQSDSHTKFLLGCDYALIRKEFYHNQHKNRKASNLNSAIISMGASDIHNLTSSFALSLLSLQNLQEIHLLVSRINPHVERIEQIAAKNKEKVFVHFDLNAEFLSNLIRSKDIMICPASTISLESCCVGITLVTGITAPNQQDIHDGILAKDLGFTLGSMHFISQIELIEFLQNIFTDIKTIESKLYNQSLLFDNNASERLLSSFNELWQIQ